MLPSMLVLPPSVLWMGWQSPRWRGLAAPAVSFILSRWVFVIKFICIRFLPILFSTLFKDVFYLALSVLVFTVVMPRCAHAQARYTVVCLSVCLCRLLQLLKDQ